MAIYRKGDDETPLKKKAEAQAEARDAASAKQLKKRGLTKGDSKSFGSADNHNARKLGRAKVSKDGKYLEVPRSTGKVSRVQRPVSGSTVSKINSIQAKDKKNFANATKYYGSGVIKSGKLVKGSPAMKEDLEKKSKK
jgi:hypothetical protein